MLKIDITEKLWDGVRPSSVKKTGLSEAIRASSKVLAAPLDTAKAFDDAAAAIGELAKAIGVAETATKKAKDDKKGAAAKLKGWSTQCDKAREDLAKQREQMGLVMAAKEADATLKTLAERVEAAIIDANLLAKQVESGAEKDARKLSVRLQECRNAMRDSLKATQKDGFMDYIRTAGEVMKWKVKIEDVPMPPNGKSLKTRIPVLEEAAEKARIAVEGLLEKAGGDRTGEASELAKPLIADYKEIGKTLKAFLPAVKKMNADIHMAAEKFKDLLSKGVSHEKLIPIVEQLHGKAMKVDEHAVTECARGRISRGDVQAKRIKIRESLVGAVRQEFEGIVGDEWNLIMIIYREVSEQIADVHRQVDRVLRLIGESSEAAKNATAVLGKKCDSDRSDLKNRFLK